MEHMEQINEHELNIQAIIDELDKDSNSTVADKAREKLPQFYAKFKEAFGVMDDGADANDEQKKEMILATYSMALETLNNSLNALEYSYMLTLAIERILKDEGLEYNDYVMRSIVVANEFIAKLAESAKLNVNADVSEILKELQSKREFYE